MKKRRGLFVDVDGTLVDSVYVHIEAWYKAFSNNGVIVHRSAIHKLIGMGADQIIPMITGKEAGDDVKESINLLHERYYSEKINEIELLPYSKEFLDRAMEDGMEIVLVSSAKDHEIQQYLRKMGNRFPVVSSADVKETKPSPEIFNLAMEKENLAKDSVIVIGDSVWDIEAAARAEIKSIAVLTGGFCKAGLKQAGADKIYATLKEALDDFEGLKNLFQ